MNQFKDVFTGKDTVEYNRATSSQKCIRAGGKHNDLDNVGFTARHHTFFEMLGNFSFGDYFKEAAIKFAWDLVTKEIKLSPDRLYATVYEEDDEAYELWAKIAPELKDGRILRFGRKDNYWSMGDVGPNGPCSEIHYDRGRKFGTGPNDVVNGETDRFVEIWNLVFMQFDQLRTGELVPLPKPSVDTGAGLERWAAILQDAESNYEIDLFQALINRIADLLGSHYHDNKSSHRVIADHVRALTFAIADGAGISNEGQGYVLRRILRRAARHGRLLGATQPFIHKVVPTLVEEMGGAYPEIREKQGHVENVIRAEEESFGRTLETGLQLFDDFAGKLKASGNSVVPGDAAFKLYDTYGFPVDLTEVMAEEQGMTVDLDGFEAAMKKQKEQSRAASDFGGGASAIAPILSKIPDSLPPTDFVRESLTADATVRGVYFVDDQHIAIVLDRTPFYVEAGGQVSDIGRIYNDTVELDVREMHQHKNHYIHVGPLRRGKLEDFDGYDVKPYTVTAEVNSDRRWDIMRNHTVTHLAHRALRDVLGEHIKQSGSYVGPDRMRFDFSHHQPLTDEEIARVEQIVNHEILKGHAVRTDIMNVDSARKAGAMALFGEKYGDTVRVVSVEDFSKELCGGTHVHNTAQIGPFFITLETGIASGVRRLEAITGRTAVEHMLNLKKYRQEVATIVGRPESESLSGVAQLKENNSQLQKELKKVKSEMFSGAGGTVGTKTSINDLTVWTNDFGESDREVMGAWLDSHKESHQPVVAIGVGQVNGKRTWMGGASSRAVKEFNIHIGNVARQLLPKFGGRGGGKPSFAQGSVADDTDSQALFDVALSLINELEERENA